MRVRQDLEADELQKPNTVDGSIEASLRVSHDFMSNERKHPRFKVGVLAH